MVTQPADPDIASHGAKLAVLNIQRTCVNDGPGIRTTVFFRGCTMRCRWCHNPEAQPFASSAPLEAHRSVAEIMRVIAKDRAYYRSTQGGVTLSGGEPLAQSRVGLLNLLEALKGEGIRVAIETAGDVPWRAFEASLPYVDLFLFDLKVVADAALHQTLTGRDPGQVEDNVARLAATDANVRFRMCVVPGLNDSTANIEAAAALLKSIGQPAIELMRYHDLHEQKSQSLHLSQAPLHISAERSASALEAASRAFTSLGIAAPSSASEAAPRKPIATTRVKRIQRAIRDSGHHVCLESAELKTAFYKRHGFTEPVAVQRGNLLRYLLNEKKITVYPDELLVGNFTSKRVGGSVWVEYFGTAMAINLWRIDRQEPVAFECSLSEKLRFYTKLAPFWARKSLLARTFPSPKELALFVARTLEQKAGFNNNLAGIAHFIVNCERLLRLGTRGIAEEVRQKRSEKRGEGSEFYDGVLIALRSLEEFGDRYAAHLSDLASVETDAERRAELEHMANVCARVPRDPARTFHEALQSILFLHIALCTESFENAISLGRLDQVLDPYYRADVEAGRLDYESARELLACFILKIDEVVFLNDGDTAFELGKVFESLSPVETVTVGGVDRDGDDCTNDVTYMILDVCELKPIGVNMAARIHHDSPDEYVERIADVYLNGSPMPALFNDDVYVPALRHEYATPLEDARRYAIVGCVEPVASDDHFANTDSANVNVAIPFLQALEGDTRPLWRRGVLDQLDEKMIEALRARIGHGRVRRTLQVGARSAARVRSSWRPRRRRGRRPGLVPPATMDALMERFQERLDELVRDVLADQQRIEAALSQNLPTPLASSLYRGCVERGKDAYEGGTTHNSSGIQALGVTDVVDSLLAIDEVVFQKKRCSLDEVRAAARANFEGERHRQIREALLAAPKFGDDSSMEAHHWMNRVLQIYVNALRAAHHESRGGKYVAGYYGLNANRVYGKNTPALPSGRLSGVPLAHSICPHFGMQMVDLTSALNAIAKVDFTRYAPNGTTVTSTIDSGLFPGVRGRQNLAGLIRGYFNQGGMQFQPNLVDRELLLDAYQNPGKHKDLVVRIAGYCGYFDDLSDELKREIIDRSYYSR